ncbi:MAG: hypothetical protein ACK5HP_02910 [Bacilli bacterium]
MKKTDKKQSNKVASNRTNSSVKNCKNNNVKSSANTKKNIGFENETRSFNLDENDDHSFELR